MNLDIVELKEPEKWVLHICNADMQVNIGTYLVEYFFLIRPSMINLEFNYSFKV